MTEAPAAGRRARDTAPDERFRWRDLREAPRAVWLITATFVLLLVVSTVVYPPYRGPDEPQQVDLVIALDHGFSPWWSPDSRQVVAGVRAGELVRNIRLHSPAHLGDAPLPPRAARPSFDGAGGDRPSSLANQLVQHPPLFYVLEAGVLSLLPHWEKQPFDRVVTLLRLVGVVMIAPLPLLAFACARRLTRSRVVPVISAGLVLGVPQVLHISASVNNDSLQNVLAGLLTVLLAYVATGDLCRRTAMSLGLVLGAALLTKGLLLVFIPLVAVAYLVGWRRGTPPRLPAGSCALALVVAFLVGGWWWLRNVLEFGHVQPVSATVPTTVVRGIGAEAVEWAAKFFFFVNTRFWFDQPSGSSTGLAMPLSFLALGLVVILVVAAFARTRDTSRRVLTLMTAPMALLGLTLLSGSWSAFTHGFDEPALQGRYLFGGIVGAAAVSAVGLRQGLRRLHPVALLVAVSAWCVLVQVVALVSALRLYYWPRDGGLGSMVGGLLSVPPWPTPVSVLLATATVLAATLSVRETLRYGRE